MDTSPSMSTTTHVLSAPNVLKLNHSLFCLIDPQPLTRRTNARVAKKSQNETLQIKPEATGAFLPRFHPHRHVFPFVFLWHRKVIWLIKSTALIVQGNVRAAWPTETLKMSLTAPARFPKQKADPFKASLLLRLHPLDNA